MSQFSWIDSWLDDFESRANQRPEFEILNANRLAVDLVRRLCVGAEKDYGLNAISKRFPALLHTMCANHPGIMKD